MIALPALDLLDGRVVRLAQGDFARVTEFSADPVAIACRYRDAGAQWLHVVSLDGARDGGDTLVGVVAALAKTGLRIQAGGGVRSTEMIGRVSEAGAERVVVGSVAVSDTRSVAGWLDEYGSGAITLALDVAIDAAGEPRPVLHGWRDTAEVSLWDLLDHYAGHGLRHLLCTDVARDGMGTGPNFELYAQILERQPGLELQASGGVATLADVTRLRELGVGGVIVGKALLAGAFTPEAFVAACT